jgi:hypothetical protein
MTRSGISSALVAVLLAGGVLAAEDKATLSADDRAAIQQLTADYAKALGTCAGEDWAKLFEPDGVFASGPRGAVRGHDRLVAMVESEPQCNTPGPKTARPAPMAEIQPAPGGAIGRIPLGADGSTYYDDTYVKTKAGWRFKYRQVITGNETKAGLKAEDFLAIRRLAGDGGKDVGDVWSETPQGWRFRSSGLTIAATPEGVTGRLHLKSGGRYDDVYVNTSNGWRFQSRTFVPEVAPGRGGATQQVR